MPGAKGGEFVQHTPEEEFRQYTANEMRRLRSSDRPFDQDLYRRAVELVLTRLKKDQA